MKNILEFYRKNKSLSKSFLYNLEQLINYYDSITDEIRQKLLLVKKKYNYNNLKNIQHIQCLEFFRDICDYNVVITLVDVLDRDEEFGTIIKACDYGVFIDTGNDMEENLWYEVYKNIFYAWLAYNWQMIGGHETQISVGIRENNSSSFFSLNDFAWEDFSKFYCWKDKLIPEKRFFNRNLEFYEMYSRADLSYSFISVPTYKRTLKKADKQTIITLQPNEIIISNDNFESEKIIFNEKDYKPPLDLEKTIQISYIDIINELMNNGWIDITYWK